MTQPPETRDLKALIVHVAGFVQIVAGGEGVPWRFVRNFLVCFWWCCGTVQCLCSVVNFV